MSLPCLCSPCSPCSPPSPLGHTHGTPTGLGAVPGRDTEPVDGDEELGEAGSSPKSRHLLPVVATRTHAHTPGSSPPTPRHAAGPTLLLFLTETGSRHVCTRVCTRVCKDREEGGEEEPEPAPEAPLSPPQTFQLSQPEPSFIL